MGIQTGQLSKMSSVKKKRPESTFLQLPSDEEPDELLKESKFVLMRFCCSSLISSGFSYPPTSLTCLSLKFSHHHMSMTQPKWMVTKMNKLTFCMCLGTRAVTQIESKQARKQQNQTKLIDSSAAAGVHVCKGESFSTVCIIASS